MKVTDKMVEEAVNAQLVRGTYHSRIRMRLEAALADVPEPVQGPFVLTSEELVILGRPRGLLSERDTEALKCALDRAVRTLGAEPVQGPFVLSEVEQASLNFAKRQATTGKVDAPMAWDLVRALERAVRNLSPAPVSGGTISREQHKQEMKETLRDAYAAGLNDGAIKARVSGGNDSLVITGAEADAIDLVIHCVKRHLEGPWQEQNLKIATGALDRIFGRGSYAGGAQQPSPVSGGEWTEADYAAAQRGFDGPGADDDSDPHWFSKARYPRIVAALEAVKHRLAPAPVSPAVEPPTDLEHAAFDVLELEPLMAPNVIRECVAAWRKRFPKPAPKQRTVADMEEAAINYYGGLCNVPDFIYELIALAKK